MSDFKITFLLFTYNEERRVECMLKCLHGHGEIVVIDNESTDKTREIAKKYTDRIYQHDNGGFVENKRTMDFALSKVKTKWAYLAAVDELIPKELMDTLKQLAEQNKYKIIRIYRKNYMFGKKIYNYGKHHIRMYIPGVVDYSGNIVHSLGNILVAKNEIYDIPKKDKTSIWHFSTYNMSALERTHNRYADIEAKQRSQHNEKYNGFKALWALVFYFFGTYIGLGGFKAGWVGLFISIQIAYYKFSIYARLYELDNNITLETIEERYDKLKEQLLSEYNRS